MDDSQGCVAELPATGCSGAANRARGWTSGQRGELALGVLTGSRSAAQAAREEGVSRKFVAAQVGIAREAVLDAFPAVATGVTAADEERVLFRLDVTPRLVRRLVLALVLTCHSSFRGVIELLAEVLGISISLGTIHNITREAARQAQQINERTDLANVRIGAHDEIFQNGRPVLVGCDVASTYCYLLGLEERRDADTWGWRILELKDHGWDPDATIGVWQS